MKPLSTGPCLLPYYWSAWMDSRNPDDELEDVENFLRLREDEKNDLYDCDLLGVEAREVGTTLSLTHQKVTFGVKVNYKDQLDAGIFCRNLNQSDGKCLNYEVRFCCQSMNPATSETPGTGTTEGKD